MAARKIKRSKQARSLARQSGDSLAWLAIAAEWVLKVSGLLIAVSLAYMLYGIFSGHLTPAPEQQQRIAAIFALCAKVFSISAILLAVALFVRFYHEVAIVCLGLVVSIVTWVFFPLIVGSRASDLQAQRGTIAHNLITDMKWCGGIVFLIVVVRIILAIVDRIRHPPQPKEEGEFKEALGPDGRPQLRKKAGVKQPIWAHCWELPYCHDALKNVCPAFEKKRNCWRLKQGCNCDPTMLDKLVQIRAATRGVSVQQQITAKKYVREELAGRPAARKPSEQLIPCSKCPIYLEHQRQKFQLANPIVIVLCLALFYFFAPTFERGYKAGLIGLDKFTRTFAFTDSTRTRPEKESDEERVPAGPGRTVVKVRKFYTRKPMLSREEQQQRGYYLATWLGNELNERTVFWIIYVVVCVFFLAYVLKVVEWAILKKKW